MVERVKATLVLLVAVEPEVLVTLSVAEAELADSVKLKFRVDGLADLAIPSTGVAERKEIGNNIAMMVRVRRNAEIRATLRQLRR